VLAIIATSVALVVARLGGTVVQRVLLPGISWNDSVIDGRVLGITLVVAVLCVFLAGLAPAIQGARAGVNEGLKSSSRQIAGGSGRVRASLLAIQVSLSVILLVGAGLFVRSLRRVVAHDVGVDLDRVALVMFDVGHAKLSSAEYRELYGEARDRAMRLPGVERAALVSGTVPGRMASAYGMIVSGKKSIDFPGGGPYTVVADGGYLTTIGTHVVRGRLFTPEEEAAPSQVMMVNRMVADAYWPGEQPVGKCITIADEKYCRTIVGVVENSMLFKFVGDGAAMLYFPPDRALSDYQPSALVVRSKGDAAQLVPLLQRTLHGLRPNVTYVNVASYADIVAPQLRPWRLGATMFSMFGILATIIAAVGLYSVMAYWASQRTHEIGVRMALGAEPRDIVRLIATQATRTVALGLVAGVLLALLLSRWIADLLYETSPHQLSAYAAAGLALGAAALVAMIVPARRVASVDPAEALRTE
jgi:predicted permease